MSIRFLRAGLMSSEAGPPGLRRALNHLAGQRSPYLLQHQGNPVDWHPWNADSLALAKRLDRPIFLSIGYSTCHWCHVMERECFNSQEIAEQLNGGFVSIMVDREERPDLDRQFMAFVQAITGHGGWPLTVFLTPSLTPFFGGTYFPPTDSGGMPGLPRLLTAISKKWTESRDEVERAGGQILEAIKRAARKEHEPGDDYDARLQHACNAAFDHLAGSFDLAYGGFGGAPKFPTPSQLEFLLRIAHNGNTTAKGMLVKTLEGMALGGIRDHLEGGFHRYTVDQRWHLPHFEKMLYDQGQLMRVYASAYAIQAEPLFKEVVEGIFEYATGHLCSPEGAFCCAEDADSRGGDGQIVEGAFAVWRAAEIRSALKDDGLFRVFSAHFGVREGGNVDPADDAHGDFAGKNVLDRLMRDGVVQSEDEAKLAEAIELMRGARAARPRPHRDDKVLTSWNGLMISGLCRAYRVFKEQRYLDAAERALGALLAMRMTKGGGGGLLHSDGIKAFGDDYTFLIQALLDVYEITLDTGLLQQAIALQDELDEACWSDAASEGASGWSYSLSRQCTERLLPLPDDNDGSEPSVNSVAYGNLTRLALLGDDTQYGKRLKQLKGAFVKRLEEAPLAMPALLSAFLLHQHPPTLIVIEGPAREDPAVVAFKDTALAQFSPDYVIRFQEAPRPSAHLCIRVCSEKIYSPEELARML